MTKIPITNVKLNGSRYSLVRDGDGAGDSGRMLNAIHPEIMEDIPGQIIIGYLIQCGSRFPRSMQWQDWWLTTPVVEILSVNDDRTEVKFKTKNSTYTVRAS